MGQNNKNKEIKRSTGVLQYIRDRYDKFIKKLEKRFDYEKWIFPYLDQVFEIPMRSLEEREIAEKVIKQAVKLTPTVHAVNLERNQEQITHFSEKIRRKKKLNAEGSNNNNSEVVERHRKEKGIQKTHPTAERALGYIVKELTVEQELIQERLGLPVSANAAVFRFYHKLLENKIYLQGISKVIAGIFGIIYNRPSNWLVLANSIFNGISHYHDTDNPRYRDKRFYDNTSVEIATDLIDRFEETSFFETVPLDEQEYHREIKRNISRHNTHWFKFRDASENESFCIDKIIELFTQPGDLSLPVDSIPSYNLQHTLIEDFVLSEDIYGEDLEVVRKIDARKLPSLLNSEFRRVFLLNNGLEGKKMKDNKLIPVLKSDNPNDRIEWKEIEQLTEKVKLEIAMEALSRPFSFRQLQKFNLVVELDGKEETTIESDYGKRGDITIPLNSKIVTVWAKLNDSAFSEIAIPLATILLEFTEVVDGIKWSSESILDNGNHLGLRLIPIKDLNDQVISINLTVDYHTADCCQFASHKKRIIAKMRAWLRDKFIDFVPIPVASFLQNIEAIGLYSEIESNQKTIKNTFAFAVVVNSIALFIICLLLAFISKSKMFSIATILIPTILIMIALFDIVLLKLGLLKGINRIIGLSNRLGFITGVLSIVILSVLFTLISTNRMLSDQRNGKQGNSFKERASSKNSIICLLRGYSNNPTKTTTVSENSDIYKKLSALLLIGKQEDKDWELAVQNYYYSLSQKQDDSLSIAEISILLNNSVVLTDFSNTQTKESSQLYSSSKKINTSISVSMGGNKNSYRAKTTNLQKLREAVNSRRLKQGIKVFAYVIRAAEEGNKNESSQFANRELLNATVEKQGNNVALKFNQDTLKFNSNDVVLVYLGHSSDSSNENDTQKKQESSQTEVIKNTTQIGTSMVSDGYQITSSKLTPDTQSQPLTMLSSLTTKSDE